MVVSVETGDTSASHLQLLEAAICNMTEAVIITDPSTLEIIFINPAASHITGYDVSELIGQSISILYGPKTEKTIIEKLHAAMDHGQPATVETYNYRKDETPFICNWSVSPLNDNQGRILHWIQILRNVTEQRKAEEELLHTRKLSAVGELAGGIAHEFKNLLTPMLLQIQSVMDDLSSRKDLLSELEIVKEAASKARDLSERVLMLGKKTPMRNEWQKLDLLIDDNLKLICKTIDRRIEVGVRITPNLPNLLICKFSFSQIMLNLIFNARDTLLEKLKEGSSTGWIPRITIALEQVQSIQPTIIGMGDAPITCQRFAIEDNGKGIPIHIQDRMFEPFFTTKSEGQGNGLGLSVVWNLVHTMGGWLNVQSVPGIGTRMLMFFPEVSSALPHSPSEVSEKNDTADLKFENKHVLLVEDEPIVSRAITHQLKKIGMEVTLASNGRDGMEHVQEKAKYWDLIISDLNMPQMDGADFIKNIRSSDFSGKVIVVSGFVSHADKERLTQAGVDAVLSKPISKEELLDAIKKIMADKS